MNTKGQITAEYILLLVVIFIVLISTSNIIQQESEKNIILTSAQIGAQIGVDKNGYAMYYNDTFNNYQNNYPKLLKTTEIKVIKINMYEQDKDIILEVVLHSNSYLTNNEKYIVGSSVNYYVRKTISETFDLISTDTYYNQIHTENYKIKTKIVKWV